jgi:hypothetical protein
MTDVERLQKAIFDLHGCKSKHQGYLHVHETFEGKTVWDGDVEIFALEKHPRATKAYAWSYKDDAGKEHYVAILGVHPVDNPQAAVQAYIVAQAEKEK